MISTATAPKRQQNGEQLGRQAETCRTSSDGVEGGRAVLDLAAAWTDGNFPRAILIHENVLARDYVHADHDRDLPPTETGTGRRSRRFL